MTPSQKVTDELLSMVSDERRIVVAENDSDEIESIDDANSAEAMFDTPKTFAELRDAGADLTFIRPLPVGRAIEGIYMGPGPRVTYNNVTLDTFTVRRDNGIVLHVHTMDNVTRFLASGGPEGRAITPGDRIYVYRAGKSETRNDAGDGRKRSVNNCVCQYLQPRK